MTRGGNTDRVAPQGDGPGPAWRFALILAAALGLRLFFALTHPVDYNAYWHVFIARNLRREYGGLAHPPLFLVLLKLADAVRHSSLAYQSVSLLSGLGVVVLTRSILLRLRASASAADLGALTMAVAQPAVILSCGVQSYMLAAFFIFASFLPYIDLAGPDLPRPRRAASFAVLVSLGLLTEYYTAFYLAAAALAPVLVAACRPAYRAALRTDLPRRIRLHVAAFAPPAAVAAAVYLVLARPWVQKFNTIPQFYFQPDRETAAAFLVRNLWNLFNTFAPVTVWSPRPAAVLLLGFVVVAFALAVSDPRREASADARGLPAGVLVLLLGIGIALGLKGPYPFGGLMRQQFLYFLFAIPAGFVAFDRLLRGVDRARARAAIAAAGAALLVLNLAWHRRDFRNLGHVDFTKQARAFDRLFPDAEVLHVDQLNLIGFFMTHDDWRWRFAGRDPRNPLVERYVLEKDGRRLTLVAHRDSWNFDFHDPKLYERLRSALAPGDPDCLHVFCVHTNLYKPAERRLPDLEGDEIRRSIAGLAPAAQLAPRRVEIRGNDVYAEICRTPAAP